MALYGGFSSSMMAMLSQSYALDVIGTNVANVGTTGYKRSEVDFSTLLSASINNTSDLGGVSPKTFQRIDAQGSITASSRELDTAIAGRGFYVLNSELDGSGDTYYTRNGSFYTVAGDTITVASDDGSTTIETQEAYLTDKNGYYVMGWQANTDGTFNTSSTMSAMRVDSYAFESTGVATTQALLDVNLPADDDAGSTFSYSMEVFDSQGDPRVVTMNFEKQAGNNAWTATPTWQDVAVAQVDTIALGGTVEAGDQYSATVAGATVTYTVTGAEADMAAVRDGLMALMSANSTMTDAVTIAASGTADITLTANTAGTGFTATASTTQGPSNTAQVDTVTLGGTVETGDIYTVTIDGTPVTYVTQPADTLLSDIRDGLVAAINLAGLGVTAAPSGANLTLTADTAGTAFTSSAAATDVGGTADESATLVNTTANYTAVTDNTNALTTTTANNDGEYTGTATALTFNSDGDLITGSPIALDITWDGGGAITTSLDLSQVSQYSGDYINHSYSQDGYGAGYLESVSFDEQGRMVGSFTNAQDRSIYRLGLANFVNPDGLESLNGNVFQESPESGSAAIFAPAENSYANLAPNALEMSNVTLENEFASMIMTQNAYNSASTVFRTVDEMLTVARDLKR